MHPGASVRASGRPTHRFRTPFGDPGSPEWALLAAAVVLLGSSCDLADPGSQPDTLVVTPDVMVLDALGATLGFSALVRDETGIRIQGVPLEWEVEDPSVSHVTEGGVVEAVANGTTRVTARYRHLQATATVRVEQVPRDVDPLAGVSQRVRAGSTLPRSVVLQITDRLGHPVPEAEAQLGPSHGGSVAPEAPTADAEGRVEVEWTLGPEPGVQHLAVTVGGRHRFFVLAEAEDESGRVPFRIRARGVTELSPAVERAFDDAAARWEELLAQKLPPVLVRVEAGLCGDDAPALDEVVDDLLVLLAVEEMDGPEGMVASASPCFLREESLLPIAGQLRLDRDDVDALVETDLLGDVILHELAHVLGVGSLWEPFERLRLPSLPDARGADTHFDGPRATAAFDEAGGSDYAGAKVPVENELGGEGTRDRHWRESVMGNELLTGLLSADEPNPLSRITVASLADLGYQVREDLADPYELPRAGAAVDRGLLLRLLHGPSTDPVYVLSADGTVLRRLVR